MPVISNFIGSTVHPIDKHHDLWNGFLPHNRATAAQNTPIATGAGYSYGDYFTVAQKFLTENSFRNLIDPCSTILERQITLDAIETVDLCLVKHGRYYHPAKVIVGLNGKKISFVLNVAVSKAGQDIIGQEFATLARLNDEFPISFLPKVYAFGEITDPNGSVVKMFLGQWLSDYHEFHLSPYLNGDQSRQQIIVWNGRHSQLEDDKILDLLQKAGMILSMYYNPETFEQIFPWHHAAGDFVVKQNKDQLSLKLISVRGYVPMMEPDEEKPLTEERLLEALLLFCVQLTLRMRMDRVDGIGDLIFYHAGCIPSILKGFFQGLDLLAGMRGYPEEFCYAVKAYFSAVSDDDLLELTRACFFSLINSGQKDFDVDLKQHALMFKKGLEALSELKE